MNTSSFASAINVSSNGISLIEFLYFTYFSPPGFHPRKKTKKKQMMSRPKSKRSTGFRSIRSSVCIRQQQHLQQLPVLQVLQYCTIEAYGCTRLNEKSMKRLAATFKQHLE